MDRRLSSPIPHNSGTCDMGIPKMVLGTRLTQGVLGSLGTVMAGAQATSPSLTEPVESKYPIFKDSGPKSH